MTLEDKMQILHDHYKDTFSLQREYLKLRERLFIYVLLTVAIMVILSIIPGHTSSEALTKIAEDKLGTKIVINQDAIDGVLWFVLLSFVVRYFQANNTVERNYDYIHKIEPELNRLFNEGASTPNLSLFQREGQEYLNNYKNFSNVVFYLYTVIFPVILLSVTGYKIYLQLMAKSQFDIVLYYDIVICGLIYVVVIQYSITLHYGRIQKTGRLIMRLFRTIWSFIT